MYFESHAHYNDTRYDEDRNKILEELKQNNVSYLINIGTDIKTSIESIELAKNYDFIYATVGIHPHDAKDMTNQDIQTLEELCKNEKVVAIGEIGLDFYYDNSPKEIQKEVFIKQLKLAKKLNKPVVIHSREASQEVFDIIKSSGVNKGVIHAYSGSKEMALEYNNLGFYIGVGGVVTFKNAKKLVEVVENVPLEKILIETDAPYLTPEPFRGTRNDSTKLKYVVEKIANIKNITPEEVEKITLNNGLNLFFQEETV